MATIEELRIVMGAITSCQTIEDIVKNVKLSEDVVTECVEALRQLGKIKKDQFTNTVCPIELTVNGICMCCQDIYRQMSGVDFANNGMPMSEMEGSDLEAAIDEVTQKLRGVEDGMSNEATQEK